MHNRIRAALRSMSAEVRDGMFSVSRPEDGREEGVIFVYLICVYAIDPAILIISDIQSWSIILTKIKESIFTSLWLLSNIGL